MESSVCARTMAGSVSSVGYVNLFRDPCGSGLLQSPVYGSIIEAASYAEQMIGESWSFVSCRMVSPPLQA